MDSSEEYVQAVMDTGERLPAAMGEANMPQEIMNDPVFDGQAIVDAQGE